MNSTVKASKLLESGGQEIHVHVQVKRIVCIHAKCPSSPLPVA